MGRAAVFIDGANLFFTQRHLGWQIDFSRLMSFFMSGYASVQANYYCTRLSYHLKIGQKNCQQGNRSDCHERQP